MIKKKILSPSLVHMLQHKSIKSTIQHCFKNGNLILMLQSTKNNLKANMYKPSGKKKFNRVDSDDHLSTSTKETIQWFPFRTIMEYTANKMKETNGLMPSLLKMFLMFGIRLSY